MGKKKRKWLYLACDFETTVMPKGIPQTETEVWASAVVELYTEDVHIFHSIRETWDYLNSLNKNIVCYYHNLRFDGSFWLNFLMLDLKYDMACIIRQEVPEYYGSDIVWLGKYDMPPGTYSYHISAEGQWYYVTIKTNTGRTIELRDSFKLIPFSIAKIGKDFETKHRKLKMRYEGIRYAGCPITEDEAKYIANDVLVQKEALEIMFDSGHDRLTIGSCCLEEFKALFSPYRIEYREFFPDVYDMWLDKAIYGADNVGRYVWRAYRGAWCYLVEGKENKRLENGFTLDVNGLYSYVMHSKSGNKYPIRKPTFWSGNFIPDIAFADDKFFYIRIKTRFYLKKGKLPFIQIKGSMFYKATECLKSSDRVDKKTGEAIPYVIGWDGDIEDTRVTMTVTQVDFELIKEHYNLVDFEILDGCYFQAKVGLFDSYIDKYQGIKQTSTGSRRTLAKLFLNNLYGKMAASTDSSFKFAYLKDDGVIGFYRVTRNDREPGYIPIGAAITSYARCYTIRAAQANFYGADRGGFIYADTDSIHCNMDFSLVKGVRVDNYDLGAWKRESEWDYGIFVRQKTYIEHIVKDGDKDVVPGFYNIKCAGMNDKCKQLFRMSLEGEVPENYETEEGELSNEQKAFLFDSEGNVIKRSLEDFKVGLKIHGKLLPRMIKGGVLLVNTTYEMR